MQQRMGPDEHQDSFEITAEADRQGRHHLREAFRKGDRYNRRPPRQPDLERAPRRKIYFRFNAVSRKRSEHSGGLILGIRDREAQHPRLILRMQAQARRGDNQTGRAFPFDQSRGQAVLVFSTVS
jgi:hypothetical protein